MKKFENFRNNVKKIFEDVKNYVKENYNKNKTTIIKWSRIVLTIVMAILLVCSFIMINDLYDRVDDISGQLQSVKSSVESQKTSSEVKSDDKSTSSAISSSTESISTSSTTSTSSKPTSSTSTSSKTVTSKPETSKTTTSNGYSIVITDTSSDLELLACVIYQEAGGNGSCDDCRRRVADVVLNRVADPRFPNTIRGVLSAKNQYGSFYYTGIKWPDRAKNYYEKDAVARAYRIAEEVLNGQHSDLYGKGYVWQAAFKQGTSQIYHCGEYFGK